MNTTTIVSAHEARKTLGELLNQAFYQGTPFVLTRGKKPMATLIGAKEWNQILTSIEEHDPGLADTLALMSNPEVQAILDEGEEDRKAGRLIPLEEVMRES